MLRLTGSALAAASAIERRAGVHRTGAAVRSPVGRGARIRHRLAAVDGVAREAGRATLVVRLEQTGAAVTPGSRALGVREIAVRLADAFGRTRAGGLDAAWLDATPAAALGLLGAIAVPRAAHTGAAPRDDERDHAVRLEPHLRHARADPLALGSHHGDAHEVRVRREPTELGHGLPNEIILPARRWNFLHAIRSNGSAARVAAAKDLGAHGDEVPPRREIAAYLDDEERRRIASAAQDSDQGRDRQGRAVASPAPCPWRARAPVHGGRIARLEGIVSITCSGRRPRRGSIR